MRHAQKPGTSTVLSRPISVESSWTLRARASATQRDSSLGHQGKETHMSCIGSSIPPPSTPECRSFWCDAICARASMSSQTRASASVVATHLDAAVHDAAQPVRDARRVAPDPRRVAASHSSNPRLHPHTTHASKPHTHLTRIASIGPIKSCARNPPNHDHNPPLRRRKTQAHAPCAAARPP